MSDSNNVMLPSSFYQEGLLDFPNILKCQLECFPSPPPNFNVIIRVGDYVSGNKKPKRHIPELVLPTLCPDSLSVSG